MAYSAEISRANPTCFLFLIDQSGSMADVMPAATGRRRKADALADAINRLLQELVIRCAKEEGVWDYFHVGLIGYGASGVGPAFSGNLAGRELVPISDVGNMPTRVEERSKREDDGAGGIVERTIRIPVWLEPVANGGTPMCQALSKAQKTMEGWLAQHPNCFPPVVIHITDGESTDGDPTGHMRNLTKMASADGTVLLFNVHISSNPNATAVAFPDSASNLQDQYSRMLFDSATVLTPYMRSVANDRHGLGLTDGARGFVLNGDMVLVVQALDIGTRPGNLR